MRKAATWMGCILVGWCLSACLSAAEPSVVASPLYPKAMYFRYVAPGVKAPVVDTEKWLRRWQFLDGIVISVLDDIAYPRPNSLTHLGELYKQRYPDKLALLHISGAARDPELANSALGAAHFMTYAGAFVDHLEADANSLRLPDSDLARFHTGFGLWNRANDDLVITTVIDGRPDWRHYEYGRLQSIDHDKRELVLERGKWGTRPLGGDNLYIAPLFTSGPWTQFSDKLNWRYNYANADLPAILVDELASWLIEPGKLAYFDGVEFDALSQTLAVARPARRGGLDLNGDGVFDTKDTNAVGDFEQGVSRFLSQLRSRLGPDRLILADGHRQNHARAVGVLNGIESEGWPNHFDVNLYDWSGGLNRHRFWREFGAEPVLSYIRVGEYHTSLEGIQAFTPAQQRMVVAGALLTDSIIVPANRIYGVPFHKWPELSGGKGRYKPWLGRAQADTQFLLAGAKPLAVNVLAGENSELSVEAGRTLVKSVDQVSGEKRIILRIAAADLVTGELTLALTGQTLAGKSVQWVEVGVGNGCSSPAETSGILNKTPTNNRYFLSEVESNGDTCDIQLRIDGGGAVALSDISVYAAADVALRQFDKGFVLANPSPIAQRRELNIGLGCRLRKASAADAMPMVVPADGRGYATVVLPAKDAIFYKTLCQ